METILKVVIYNMKTCEIIRVEERVFKSQGEEILITDEEDADIVDSAEWEKRVNNFNKGISKF